MGSFGEKYNICLKDIKLTGAKLHCKSKPL